MSNQVQFEDFLTRCIRPKEADLVSPKRIHLKLENDDKMGSYELLKGARLALFNKDIFNMKMSVADGVYKKSEQLWNELRDKLLEDCKDRPTEYERFDLTKPTVIYFATDRGDIVDIYDAKNLDRVEEIEEANHRFIIELTTRQNTNTMFQSGKGGWEKFILYDTNKSIESDTYTPVVILELNHQKSEYFVYNGILIFTKSSEFIFIPALSANISTKSYCDFLLHFDLKDFLQVATESASSLYEAYQKFLESSPEISAREMTVLLKKIGCKPEITEDSLDKVAPLANIADDVYNAKLQDYYNSFRFVTGESANDLLKMGDFRKSFRYNKIRLIDMVIMLSQEYINNNNSQVSIKILGDIICKLYNSLTSDKGQVELVLNEQK